MGRCTAEVFRCDSPGKLRSGWAGPMVKAERSYDCFQCEHTSLVQLQSILPCTVQLKVLALGVELECIILYLIYQYCYEGMGRLTNNTTWIQIVTDFIRYWRDYNDTTDFNN
jgi:hypothetical protein